MIDRFSWHYRIIEKILDFVTWYFNKENYYFYTKIIYKPEKENQEKLEESYKIKYYQTKEGKKELKERWKHVKT